MMGLVPKPRASGWGKRLSPLSFPQETLFPALSPGDSLPCPFPRRQAGFPNKFVLRWQVGASQQSVSTACSLGGSWHQNPAGAGSWAVPKGAARSGSSLPRRMPVQPNRRGKAVSLSLGSSDAHLLGALPEVRPILTLSGHLWLHRPHVGGCGPSLSL